MFVDASYPGRADVTSQIDVVEQEEKPFIELPPDSIPDTEQDTRTNQEQINSFLRDEKAKIPVAVFHATTGADGQLKPQLEVQRKNFAAIYQEHQQNQQAGEQRTSQLLPEMLSILKQAESAEQSQNMLDALGAAYEQLLGDTSAEEFRQVQEQTKQESWWCFDKEFAQDTAKKLHASYQGFHIANGMMAERRAKNNERVNLVTTPFEELEDKWKQVNTESGQHLLIILQTLSKYNPDFFANLNAKDLEDDPIVFKISSAWYQIWADDGDVNVENSRRNPLFYRSSYDEFQNIADEKGEPKEGWSKFIQLYREYMKANKDSYALIMKSFDFENKVKVLDDGQLSEAEINDLSEDDLKQVILRHAGYELKKDKAMTITMLLSLGLEDKIQQRKN